MEKRESGADVAMPKYPAGEMTEESASVLSYTSRMFAV
jgi:hypothetical protein